MIKCLRKDLLVFKFFEGDGVDFLGDRGSAGDLLIANRSSSGVVLTTEPSSKPLIV